MLRASSWRSVVRHSFSLSSWPMPQTLRSSCRDCRERSFSRPSSTSITCPEPNFCPRSLSSRLSADSLTQREHRIEVGAGVALELLAALALVDEPALTDHVSEPIGHPGCRGQPVTAGAAGLLVVALDRLGQVEVGDEAHIGFVDAHA